MCFSGFLFPIRRGPFFLKLCFLGQCTGCTRDVADRHYGFIPQTVLALWGSGVFKAGEGAPEFPTSWTFPDTGNHWKMSL